MVRNDSSVPFSTAVLIRLMTFSTLDFEIYLLGFSYFSLFYNEEGNPILDEKSKSASLINGYYQIPIFWGSPEIRTFGHDDLYHLYPTIPCSSILIGVTMSKLSEPKPMPSYSQKLYNTIFFEVTEVELRLFNEQSKREPLNAREYTMAYYKFKGITRYDKEDLEKYLFQSLAFKK